MVIGAKQKPSISLGDIMKFLMILKLALTILHLKVYPQPTESPSRIILTGLAPRYKLGGIQTLSYIVSS
jgi:hypothetical protein